MMDGNFNMKHFFPKLHIELERWKYYMPLDVYVSTEGRIKNKEGKICSVCKKDGYLYFLGKPVHRIVMETWKPVPGYAKLTVDHKNHNTFDNSISNLSWMTAEENITQDAKDRKINAPQTAVNTVNINKMFMLNAQVMSKEDAIKILKNDKTISGCANIERAFQKAVNKNGEPVKFGGYSISYVKGNK